MVALLKKINGGNAKSVDVHEKRKDDDESASQQSSVTTNREKIKNMASTFLKDSAEVLKSGATEAVKEVSKAQSNFQTWSSDSLRQLLVQYNIQVRASSYTSHQDLVRICNEVFGPSQQKFKEEEFRRLYTFEEIGRMDRAARRLQNFYIEKKARKLNEAVYEEHLYYNQVNITNHYDPSLNYYYDRVSIQPPYNNHSMMHGHNETNAMNYHHNGDHYHHRPNQHSDGQGMPELAEEDEMDEEYNSSIHDGEDKFTNIPLDHEQEEYKIDDVGESIEIEGEEYDEEIMVEWRKPSWKYAKKYEQYNRPHRSGKNMSKYKWRKVTLGRHCTPGGCGEQLDLWNEGQISEFSQFGSGITNYFKFIKWCCWVMFILSCIHMPVIVLNMFGTTLKTDTNKVALTTLGNLGNSYQKSFVRIPRCDENEYQFEHCAIDKNDLALIYAFLDGVGTLVVIFAWSWLRVFEKKEVNTLNRSTVSVSDYTLKVVNIPPNVSERQLAVHFANVTGEAVAEVHLAFKNSKEIQLHFQRGQLMKDRFQCVERIRYERTIGQQKTGKKGLTAKKRLKKLLKEREKLTSTIQIKDEERFAKVNPTPKAIQAFVTFETEHGFIKAVSAYQLSWIRSICCLYPKRLKFKNKKLRISQAPEPSTLIWENLEYSSRSRFFRKCLTTGVATMAIFLSIIFTFLSRDFRSKTLQSAIKPCPDGFNDLSKEAQYRIVSSDIELSHCYCNNLSFGEQGNEELCLEFLKDNVKASVMAYGAGFMVCFMNAFFTWLMDKAGTFEKHQSLDKMEGSNMARVFVLKLINTGFLVLLYNQKWLQRLVGVQFPDPQNFNVDWYETGGVSIVIVMVINIISPHVAPLLEYRKHRAKIRAIEKNLIDNKETNDDYRVWYTQEELNTSYLGPPFRLNYRYTQLLVTFFICWMYSMSMPVLPIVGAISFYLTYWVDKFLFCNLYRIPPKYSDDMGKTSTSLIGLSIILHVFMSIWILGSGKIFTGKSILNRDRIDDTKSKLPTNGSIPFKKIIFQEHIVVLEVILIGFLCGHVFKKSFAAGGRNLLRCFRCLICSSGNKVKRLQSMMNTVQVNYTSAKARGVIKGLASYNILQNPKYQEAFAISNEFAMTHNRLSSIRGFNTKDGDLCISSESEEKMEPAV